MRRIRVGRLTSVISVPCTGGGHRSNDIDDLPSRKISHRTVRNAEFVQDFLRLFQMQTTKIRIGTRDRFLRLHRFGFYFLNEDSPSNRSCGPSRSTHSSVRFVRDANVRKAFVTTSWIRKTAKLKPTFAFQRIEIGFGRVPRRTFHLGAERERERFNNQ